MHFNWFLSFLCLFSLIFVFLSLEKVKSNKNIEYSKQKYELIKVNYSSNKFNLHKIKTYNPNISIYLINKEKNPDITSDVPSLKNFESFSTQDIKLYDDYKIFNENILIISSKKYFNNLKFIFSDKQINNKEMKMIFKIEFDENEKVLRYLLKKDQVLNCKIINFSNNQIKYCLKYHDIVLKNFEIPEIIFKKYKYSYFNIDNQSVNFKNVQF